MSDTGYHLQLRDVATGALRSQRDTGYYGASALIDGDTLYLVDDGTSAITLSTGKQLWHVKTELKLKRVFNGVLLGERTYETVTVALRTSDGATAWTFEGSIAGSHEGVLALERMHVGPEYRIHKIDPQTGREISAESQDDFKRDYPFHENLTVAGVAFSAPYRNHYGDTYQRLHYYSKESISCDEWIEARAPGTGTLYWQTQKLWGWVTDLVPAGNLVIRAGSALSGGKAAIHAWRATRESH